MAATIHGDSAVLLATMVAPVAVYFLILGVLNSRRRPVLISARSDFLLLGGALSPLCIYPAMQLAGVSWILLAFSAAILTSVTLYIMPRRGGFVIYNLPSAKARSVIGQVLSELTGRADLVQITGFAQLRNTTVRLVGPDKQFSQAFEQALADRLADMPVEASAMATGLLLVATGMLAAPLSLMAHRTVQIVRILGDLLN